MKFAIPDNISFSRLKRKEVRHPRMSAGLRYIDGKVHVMEHKNVDLEIPVDLGSRASPINKEICEINDEYVVFSNLKCKNFIIIKRKKSPGKPAKHTKVDRAMLNPIGEEYNRFVELSSSEIYRVSFPTKIMEIILNGPQIIFRSNEKIYFYTPYSTSVLNVQSSDMTLAGNLLYILTPSKILIYDESLRNTIDINCECHFIKVCGDITFLFDSSSIYKFHRESFVQAYTPGATIRKVLMDSTNLYMQAREELLIMNIFTSHVTAFKLDLEEFAIKLCDRFIIISGYNNLAVYIDKNDYSKVQMVVFNRFIQGIAGYKDTICYFSPSKVTIHDISNNHGSGSNNHGSNSAHRRESSIVSDINKDNTSENAAINDAEPAFDFDEILAVYGDELENELDFTLNEETGDVDVTEISRELNEIPEHLKNLCDYIRNADESSESAEDGTEYEPVLFEDEIKVSEAIHSKLYYSKLHQYDAKNTVSAADDVVNAKNIVSAGNVANKGKNTQNTADTYSKYVDVCRTTGVSNPVQLPWKRLGYRTLKNVQTINFVDIACKRIIIPKFFVPNYMDWFEGIYNDYKHTEWPVDESVCKFLDYAIEAREDVPKSEEKEVKKKKRVIKRDVTGF